MRGRIQVRNIYKKRMVRGVGMKKEEKKKDNIGGYTKEQSSRDKPEWLLGFFSGEMKFGLWQSSQYPGTPLPSAYTNALSWALMHGKKSGRSKNGGGGREGGGGGRGM